jgi:hypothetical protein
VTVSVSDPFGVAGDLRMPFLREALRPAEVQEQLRRCCPHLAGAGGVVPLLAVRVMRYKPGRRCLVEYDVEVEGPHTPHAAMTLVGKARAKGADRAGHALLAALWDAGFQGDSPDDVSVPEPVGVVPAFGMWLQSKVPGVPATQLLAGEEGRAVARRVAEAVHKFHGARLPLPRPRRHTKADELNILSERLAEVARDRPAWGGRLDRLLGACRRLGSGIPEPAPRGIHRDFYADQVLVDGRRLYLLDFDLYCEGDPGLDVGNFLGHLVEQSLRTLGRPDALGDREKALEERFVELAGEACRVAVRAYATLTLVRHVFLSTQFPDRRPFTESLLELCEERLGRGGLLRPQQESGVRSQESGGEASSLTPDP